jgi:hypothetical protein
MLLVESELAAYGSGCSLRPHHLNDEFLHIFFCRQKIKLSHHDCSQAFPLKKSGDDNPKLPLISALLLKGKLKRAVGNDVIVMQGNNAKNVALFD